ncbi:Protein CBG07423 [Caenorhabditis briggsae]|uniref:Protein CBG07423 n=1 Tax=Caenorhabditis briggsae TaxID=6238 RepID=A8X4T1_CAEBR|nr:Protein CBG07423 [Caenorhabditis briggsae]CAP27641.1 Protein CBG07423 [Caenorhabditis briggsae]
MKNFEVLFSIFIIAMTMFAKDPLLPDTSSGHLTKDESGSSHGNMQWMDSTVQQDQELNHNPKPWSSSIGGSIAGGDALPTPWTSSVGGPIAGGDALPKPWSSSIGCPIAGGDALPKAWSSSIGGPIAGGDALPKAWSSSIGGPIAGGDALPTPWTSSIGGPIAGGDALPTPWTSSIGGPIAGGDALPTPWTSSIGGPIAGGDALPTPWTSSIGGPIAGGDALEIILKFWMCYFTKSGNDIFSTSNGEKSFSQIDLAAAFFFQIELDERTKIIWVQWSTIRSPISFRIVPAGIRFDDYCACFFLCLSMFKNCILILLIVSNNLNVFNAIQLIIFDNWPASQNVCQSAVDDARANAMCTTKSIQINRQQGCAGDNSVKAASYAINAVASKTTGEYDFVFVGPTCTTDIRTIGDFAEIWKSPVIGYEPVFEERGVQELTSVINVAQFSVGGVAETLVILMRELNQTEISLVGSVKVMPNGLSLANDIKAYNKKCGTCQVSDHYENLGGWKADLD